MAALDFLGFGLPASYPSLGELTLQAKQNLQAPWLGLSAFFVFSLMLGLLVFIFEGVRDALTMLQHSFRREPGLVADGRDMGTVVFPDAIAKIYLTASSETRAQRRYKQLKDKDISVSLPGLFQSIQSRDERDKSRKVSPLVPAEDAYVIDSTSMTIDEVLDVVLSVVTKKLG